MTCSPWSTPNRSEYGEGFVEMSEDAFADALAHKMFVRELGDGASVIDAEHERMLPKWAVSSPRKSKPFAAFAGSPTKTRSPTRHWPPPSPEHRPAGVAASPTKQRRIRARDVIHVAQPYDSLISDDIKRWFGRSQKPEPEGEEAQSDIVAELSFANALVLKLNQIAKQGLLSRDMIFAFACHISNYDIPPPDQRKCSNSFYAYARQLSLIRESIETSQQRNEFDLEEASWVPPIFVKEKPLMRPPTAKPRDPDSYTFTDEELAKDYRKLWSEYQELQEMREQEKARSETSAPSEGRQRQIASNNESPSKSRSLKKR